jgi:hypothetical protein|tara:strand:+ start:13086 stop:13331 length:246 start_codon:yes stop_codon:yes gene_type:complete
VEERAAVIDVVMKIRVAVATAESGAAMETVMTAEEVRVEEGATEMAVAVEVTNTVAVREEGEIVEEVINAAVLPKRLRSKG